MMRAFVAVALLVVTGAAAQTPARVVSIGRTITEIVYALGAAERLAAVHEATP